MNLESLDLNIENYSIKEIKNFIRNRKSIYNR